MPGMMVEAIAFCRLDSAPPMDPVVSMLTNTSMLFTSVLKVRGLVCSPLGSSKGRTKKKSSSRR